MPELQILGGDFFWGENQSTSEHFELETRRLKPFVSPDGSMDVIDIYGKGYPVSIGETSFAKIPQISEQKGHVGVPDSPYMTSTFCYKVVLDPKREFFHTN